MKTKLDRIINNELCIGCGLCESLGNEAGYKMQIKENGFYYPSLPNKRKKEIEDNITTICPSININGNFSDSAWGKMEIAGYAYSKDTFIRQKGSSGGVISAISIHLLNEKIVDAILQVGKDVNHYLYNKLYISRNRDEVLSNASSRYAPVLVFKEFVQILNSSNEKYAFVGKPCDILAVKNFIKENHQYDGRVKYFISIVCAGISSFNATLDLLKLSDKKEQPISIQYRGDGWPGMFKAKYKDESELKVTYGESWMKYLGRQTHFRCKICPDGIGSLADFSVGDGWESKDGYPDFAEKPGRSFVFVRTKRAYKIIEDMKEGDHLAFENLNLDDLSTIQPYQYRRTLTAGFRIFPIQIITGGLFHIKNLNLLRKMTKFSFLRGLKDSLGTIQRSFHRNEY